MRDLTPSQEVRKLLEESAAALRHQGTDLKKRGKRMVRAALQVERYLEVADDGKPIGKVPSSAEAHEPEPPQVPVAQVLTGGWVRDFDSEHGRIPPGGLVRAYQSYLTRPSLHGGPIALDIAEPPRKPDPMRGARAFVGGAEIGRVLDIDWRPAPGLPYDDEPIERIWPLSFEREIDIDLGLYLRDAWVQLAFDDFQPIKVHREKGRFICPQCGMFAAVWKYIDPWMHKVKAHARLGAEDQCEFSACVVHFRKPANA